MVIVKKSVKRSSQSEQTRLEVNTLTCQTMCLSVLCLVQVLPSDEKHLPKSGKSVVQMLRTEIDLSHGVVATDRGHGGDQDYDHAAGSRGCYQFVDYKMRMSLL